MPSVFDNIASLNNNTISTKDNIAVSQGTQVSKGVENKDQMRVFTIHC